MIFKFIDRFILIARLALFVTCFALAGLLLYDRVFPARASAPCTVSSGVVYI